jgi:hypothetical protein
MYANWANSLKDSYRVGLSALAVAATLLLGLSPVLAQQAGLDVVLGSSGDRQLSSDVTIEAEAGQTVFVEFFATGYSGERGVEAILVADDTTAIARNSAGAPDITIGGGSVYSVPLPAVNFPNISGSFSTFGAPPEETDSSLKFIGSYKITLSSSFTSLTLTLVEVKFGTSSSINPNTVITIANPGSLPKTFLADLDGSPGNQNVLAGRANPGGRFGVQTFVGGLSDVDEVEVRVEIDPAQIDGAATEFIPSQHFTVVAAAGGGLSDTAASSFSNVKVDLQTMTDNTHTPDALAIVADGGSTVSLEIFGEGYEGALGVTAQVRVSDPSAIRSVSGTGAPHFAVVLAGGASIDGDVISMEIGSLSAATNATFQRVGTLNLELAPNFNGLVLEVTNVSFPPSSLSGTPNAVLTITPTGGLAPDLVQVSGNDMILRLSAAMPVSGDVALGRFAFRTTNSFRQTDLTFRQVSFITGETPATIEPNVAVSVRSNLSNAPTVSEPPAPAAITDSRALIRWVTNRAGTGKVIYGTSPGNLDQEATESTSGRVHQVGITGLDLGTRYFYKVVTSDSEGNESDAFPGKPLFFVTKRAPDTLPPRVLRGPAAVGITTDAAKILVELDEAATVDILYGSTAEDLSQTASSTEETKLHELALTGLTAGETIFFKARATDQIGNTATTARVRQFTLRSVADASAPRIVGRPTILGATFNAAVIRWLTTEPSSSKVRVGFDGTFSDSVESSELENEHTLALSNLLSDTIYTYQVESVDASGNVASSPTFNFRTRDGEDTALPRITRPPVVARRSESEALIVFQTNEPSTVTIQVDADIEVASDTTGVLGDAFSTSTASRKQEVLLTGLDAATVYFYRIAVTDLTGNGPTYNVGQLSFATLSSADTAAPVVFSRPVALGITEEGASINWAADEPHTAIIRYRAATATKQAVGDFDEALEDLELSRRHAVPIAGLALGTTYEYEVETFDAEGNSSVTSNLTFTTRSGADTDAPTIVRGPRITNITSSSATVEWGTDEPADTRVSWGASIDYTETIEEAEGVRFHSATLTGLEAGTEYHYAVGSADATGNVVTTDASGTVAGLSQDHTFRTRSADDEDPPVITEGPEVEIKNSLIIAKWRTDERSTSRITVGVLPGSDDAAVDGAPVFGEVSELVYEDNQLTRRHVVTVTGLTPGLDYLFQASSTDAFGNTVSTTNPIGAKRQPPGGFGSFTTSTEEDTQFPVITSGPTVVASTSSSLTIEWATDESSNGTVDFGTSDASLDAQEVSGTNETTHRMVLTKLTTGTTYAYQVGSTDALGNGATKSTVTFASTAAAEDLTAPVINTTPSVIYVNDRQATISWGTSEAADSEVSFGTAADALLDISNDSDFNSSHSITLTNLTAGTTYYYQVSSTDQSNNGPATSSVLEFATDSLPDTLPPTSSDVAAATTSSEALVTWTTTELSDSAVRFGTQSGSLDFNTGSSEDVLAHAITLTNLTPATTYSYTVESIDRAGNQGTASSELTFTTLAEGETPSLAAPTAVAATAGNAAVQLSWTASTSGGVVGAIVERSADGGDFSAIATLEDMTTYIDNNVANGTAYTYQVRALGLNQVQSDASAASEAVTPAAGVGPSTPVLSIRQGNPLQPTFVIENSTPLGDGDVLNYTFQLSSQSDFSDALSLDSGLGEGAGTGSGDPSGVTAWTVDRELTDGTTYHYRIKASDGTFDSDFLTGQFTVNADELPYPGDLDGNFEVGFTDFLTLVGTFNKSDGADGYNTNGDLNRDGSVDFTDFLTFVGNFGKRFVQGDAATKPIVVASYGIDAQTRLELLGRPTTSEAGGVLEVEVQAKGAQDLLGTGIRLTYDTDALEFVEAYQGNDALLSSDERRAEMFGTLEHDVSKGEIFVAGVITEGGAVSGNGVVSRLRFVLKTDHPQGNLISLAEGLLIGANLNVNVAQNLGDRLALVPENFTLEHNFPNPFNPETTIRYAIPEAARVRLVVYNVLGQEVTRLVDRDQVPGFYALRWDGKDSFGRGVASGVYLYKIHASGETQKFSQIHKMLLLK